MYEKHNEVYHLTPLRMAPIKKNTGNKCQRGCERREPSYTVGGNINRWSHCGKHSEGFSKSWKYLELPNDPAISLLGMYLNKTKTLIWKDTCTLIFIAALFTIAKMRKQPKCPSTDEQIRKMWCVYTHTHTHTETMEYYLSIKRMKFCHLQQNGWTWKALC